MGRAIVGAKGAVLGALALAALAVGVAAAPRAAVAPGVIDRLDAPADRQVVQRRNDDAAAVAVRGHVRGAVGRLFLRARPRPGARGRAVPWRMLDATVGRDGTFAGVVRLEAGGWYALDVCVVAGGRPGPVRTVPRVGVGEVFVLAGQSNAANFGDLDDAYAVDDRVSATDGAQWVHAANPLPFAQGDGGNPWVYMANRLADELDVPIGLLPTARGGSGVGLWQPGRPYFARLAAGLAAMRDRGGVRAVLWHQGETDRYRDPALYRRLLTTVILRSRAASGLDVPWVIAQVGYGPDMTALPFGTNGCDPRYQAGSIRLAQCAVARTVPGCYPGPTTDDLGPAYRGGTRMVHLNLRGLVIHGDRWAEVLLHTPELIPARLASPGAW